MILCDIPFFTWLSISCLPASEIFIKTEIIFIIFKYLSNMRLLPAELLWIGVNRAKAYLEPCQTSMMKLFEKKVNGLNVTISANKLSHRCFPGFLNTVLYCLPATNFRAIVVILIMYQSTVQSHSILTHFNPMLHFYTPWKRQKTLEKQAFLTFSGGIEMQHWAKTD